MAGRINSNVKARSAIINENQVPTGNIEQDQENSRILWIEIYLNMK